MGIVKNIADFFRAKSPGSSHKVDRYEILAPLMQAEESVTNTRTYIKLLIKDTEDFSQILKGRAKPSNMYQTKALEAYKTFVKELPSHEQSEEKKQPLSVMLMALDIIHGNIQLIEDNFSELFGDIIKEGESAVRSSSLVIFGYLELVDLLLTWVGRLISHMDAEDAEDGIPPFWTKGLHDDAKQVSEFVTNNILKWNPSHKGLLEMLKGMQKNGTDVAIKTGDTWIDDYVSDRQFSYTEQSLMEHGMRSPIAWASTRILVRHQKKMDLYQNRKDWMISKIALHEARLSNMDPDSAEYKRLRKAVENYAILVSKYEQKIERLAA